MPSLNFVKLPWLLSKLGASAYAQAGGGAGGGQAEASSLRRNESRGS
jgi:hypothetical protein